MDAKRSESVNSFGSVLTGSGVGFDWYCVEDVLARSRVAAALDFARRLGGGAVGVVVVAVLRADLTGCVGGCCWWRRWTARASVSNWKPWSFFDFCWWSESELSSVFFFGTVERRLSR